MYALLIDSAKLFFINVFLYSLYLESYVFVILFQRHFGVELPLVTVFMTGIFTFIAVTVWINLARVWYRKVKTTRAMLLRALLSEFPFAMLIGIIGIASLVSTLPFGDIRQARDLLIACVGYLVLFPLIVVMTKSHTEKVEAL